MKLINLLEIEYGSQNLLQTYQDQIKDIDPQLYRDLQTKMSNNQDDIVDKEIREMLESGKLKHIADDSSNDKSSDKPSFRGKALDFHEIEALHEDEDYCPYCANKLKEAIKKTVAECWKTHKQVGMKKKGDRTVPNCVPKNEVSSWDGKSSKSPGMWDGKPSEKDQNFPAVGEAKTKPAKGKRFAKKVKNKKTGRTRTVSYGQAGKAKKGGDRIRPGTAKGNAYCARSAKIKKCKNPPCANALSRKKWKCQGSRSVK